MSVLNGTNEMPGWHSFQNLSLDERLPMYTRQSRLFDILFSQQFDRTFINDLYELTNKIRVISRIKPGVRFLDNLCYGKRCMLYFVQPSTRTFLSFATACQILGIKITDIRDTNTSSEVKGESFSDTIRTFSSYVDAIIMRHPEADMAEFAAWSLNQTNRPIPVFNGGSGKDQHPTQALLDIYTLMRSFDNSGGIDGKTIAMVGDLKRGRTVRSLTYLMKNFQNVKILFASPHEFKMESDILSFLKRNNIQFEETENFNDIVSNADAIYMTRIQSEHDTATKSQSHYSNFAFTKEHLDILKPTSIIMHPFPRRGEIEIAVDQDPRAKYWRQERNGMWVRAALLAYIFGVDKAVMDF